MLGDLKFWVEQRLAWLVQYGAITRSASNGADAVTGRVSGVQHEARRVHPWGVRGRPPVGAETIALGVDGSSANKVEIAAEAMSRTAQGLKYSYGPNDLAEGESCQYDQAGSTVRLFADGSIRITAKGGAVITLDKDGNVTVVPKSGAQVRLGDSDAVNCENLVLFDALKNYIDSHVHRPGSYTTAMGAVTGTSGAPVSGLGTSARCSNVLGKK
ncbi:MAG: hypothetical protein U1A78_32275 [Polyangia bacterium]